MLVYRQLFTKMAEDNRPNDDKDEKKGGEFPYPPRTWLIWISLLLLAAAMFSLHERLKPEPRKVGYKELVEMLENGRMAEGGKIIHNPQSVLGVVHGKILA